MGFTIKNPPPDILGPSVVKPAHGQPGLGIEFWNFTPFKININEVTVLKK